MAFVPYSKSQESLLHMADKIRGGSHSLISDFQPLELLETNVSYL